MALYGEVLYLYFTVLKWPLICRSLSITGATGGSGHHPIEVGMAAHDVNSQDYNTSIPSLVDIQRYP
jgi:hypothetical protein